MGRPGVELRHQARARHVLDVQDEHAVMPVRHVQAVAHAQRMVAARRHVVVPGIGFAAGLVLAGNPPAPHFLGLRRIAQVQDLDDVADVARRRRRDIGVAAVEVVAVHAAALGAGLPVRDQARTVRPADVVDAQSAAEIVGAAAELLIVDDHQAVAHAHLVRMPADGHFQRRQQARAARVFDVVDRGAIGRTHVRDIHRRALHPDLSAPRNRRGRAARYSIV